MINSLSQTVIVFIKRSILDQTIEYLSYYQTLLFY